MNNKSFLCEKQEAQATCFFLDSIQNMLSEVISNGVIILEHCAVSEKYW